MMKINPREVEWFSKDSEQLRLLTNYIDFYFTVSMSLTYGVIYNCTV